MSKLTLGSPTGIISGFKDLYDSHNNHKNVAEQERTKRNQSDNQKEIAISTIQAQRDVILKSLDNDFKLKSNALNKSFEVIDYALENSNLGVLQESLTSVVKITENSSLKSLSNLQTQLEDKYSIIDV